LGQEDLAASEHFLVLVEGLLHEFHDVQDTWGRQNEEIYLRSPR
jgi:hypothetical protein